VLGWLFGTGCGLDADCQPGGTRSDGMPSQLPGLSTTDGCQGRLRSQRDSRLDLALDRLPAAVRTLGNGRACPEATRVEDPTDAVVLRLSRAQFKLVREAVDEYIYELEHNTLPPSLRELGRKNSPRRRWAADRVAELRPLYEWLETL
jgi:hypothetical protein